MKRKFVTISLLLIALFLSFSLISSEVKAYIRTDYLEFEIESPYEVYVGQMFQVQIKITNEAGTTVYLTLLRINIDGNGIGWDNRVYELESSDGIPYAEDETIYQESHTFFVNSSKFNPYGSPFIWVTIFYGCYILPRESDYGYIGYPTCIVSDVDWKTEYETLENNFDELKNNYDSLSSNYTELLSSYNLVSLDYDSLQTEYDNLLNNYNSLNSDYNSLQADYNDLKSEHEALTTDVGTTRNLNYLFIITTIIFIATTIYLAIRKPKVKPELKPT